MPIALSEQFSFDQMVLPTPSVTADAVQDRAGVVILGAGLAGLTCAHRLAQARRQRLSRSEIRVLEREPHVGGRARSLQVGASVVNLGALTFEPDHYPRYMALLTELGLAPKIRQIRHHSMLFGIGRRVARADRFSLIWDGFKSVAGQGLFTPREIAHLLRFFAFFRRATATGGEELMALHEISVAEWARRFGFSQALIRKFVEPFTHYCFRSSDEVSAAFGLFLLGFNLGRPATLDGGIGQIACAMAERLGEVIETESIVFEATREPGGFVIAYRRRGRLCRLHSRHLVVAIPANVAAQVVPAMRERARQVEYGDGQAVILSGRLKADFALHLRAVIEPGEPTIYGGEARASGNGDSVLNLLTYRGSDALREAAGLFVDGRVEKLVEYNIRPACAAPRPGYQALPIDWGEGLYMAGDCVGLFPSQETAVDSGEKVARLLNTVL